MSLSRRNQRAEDRRSHGGSEAGEAGSGPDAPAVRHVLDVDDLSTAEILNVLNRAKADDRVNTLEGRGVALYFQKPSARTRHSAELAVVQLSGHPVTVTDTEVGIDTRESAEDLARTLACYHAIIGARVFDHRILERMAAVSPVPVVNLLSDRAHPLQALADLLTIHDEFGSFEGRTVAYVGDANNVASSLALGVGRTGVGFRIASPPGYGFGEDRLARLRAAGTEVHSFEDPRAAVAGADVVYTDVWASMGQEEEAAQRAQDFAGYTVTPELMDVAAPHAVFLHCLPARRGEEVAAEVIDGPRSRVWPQAANRMRAARGLFRWLTGPPGPTPEQAVRPLTKRGAVTVKGRRR
ncbi:MAG: ornithine carbamoyltransferase [Acidimicrobiia bacterium]|nr:ornithine carbamoyltransferase [Acidimicrobiia bacterium]